MTKKLVVGSILAVILTLFCPTIVKASTKFYEGEYIPSMWIKKEKNGRIRYQQARFLRKEDDSFAYCIEPWAEIDATTDYDDIIDINSISDETLNKISLIAYYGYQYNDHQDSKWYYVTQVLIWKEIDKEADFYFTDSLNGNKITTYDNDMESIMTLVNNHEKIPSFIRQEPYRIYYGSTTNLEDYNRVLKEYEVKDISSNLEYERIDRLNYFKIKATGLGSGEVTLVRKDKIYNTPTIVYRHKEKQDFMTVGSYKEKEVKVYVEAPGFCLTIKKLDKDTGIGSPQGDAKLLGTVFGIYNKTTKERVETVTLTDNTEVTVCDLKLGQYIIKEESAGEGYQKDEKEEEINLHLGNVKATVTFENEVIKNKIIIEKYYGSEEKGFQKEANITFGFYNQKGELVETATTDLNGILELTLPYGIYTVKQETEIEGYEKVDPFQIEVKENNLHQVFHKYNLEKKGKFTLYKVDEDSKELIKNNHAKFELWKDDELIGTYETNDNGILIIDDLSYGTYNLKEIEGPEGYIFVPKELTFEIDKDHRSVEEFLTNKHEEEHIIEVPNTGIDIEENHEETFYYPIYCDRLHQYADPNRKKRK